MAHPHARAANQRKEYIILTAAPSFASLKDDRQGMALHISHISLLRYFGRHPVWRREQAPALPPAVKQDKEQSHPLPCHSERSEESRREMLLSFLRPREILHYVAIHIQGVATVFPKGTPPNGGAWQRKGGQPKE